MKNILLICFILVIKSTSTFAQKCDSLKNADGRINHYYCPQKAINAWCTISTIIDSAIVQPITTNNAYEIANGDPMDIVACPNFAPYGDESLPSFFLGGDFQIQFMLVYKNSPIGMSIEQVKEEENRKIDSLQKNDPLFIKIKNPSNTITEEDVAIAAGKSGNVTFDAVQKFAKNSFIITIYFNSTQKDVFHWMPNFTIKKSTPFTIPNIKTLLAQDIIHFNKFYDATNLDVYEKYIKESLLWKYDTYVRLGSFISNADAEKMRTNSIYEAKNITVQITGGSFEANHKVLQEIDWVKLLVATM